MCYACVVWLLRVCGGLEFELWVCWLSVCVGGCGVCVVSCGLCGCVVLMCELGRCGVYGVFVVWWSESLCVCFSGEYVGVRVCLCVCLCSVCCLCVDVVISWTCVFCRSVVRFVCALCWGLCTLCGCLCLFELCVCAYMLCVASVWVLCVGGGVCCFCGVCGCWLVVCVSVDFYVYVIRVRSNAFCGGGECL